MEDYLAKLAKYRSIYYKNRMINEAINGNFSGKYLIDSLAFKIVTSQTAYVCFWHLTENKEKCVLISHNNIRTACQEYVEEVNKYLSNTTFEWSANGRCTLYANKKF